MNQNFFMFMKDFNHRESYKNSNKHVIIEIVTSIFIKSQNKGKKFTRTFFKI